MGYDVYLGQVLIFELFLATGRAIKELK